MKYKTLLVMECMKTYSRMNIVFTAMIFALVLLQVVFIVRLEMEGMTEPAAIYDFAARYVNNIAFTFIPILLLVNVGSEFDYGAVQRSLVSGLSRGNYFIAKIIQLEIFSIIAFLLAVIFSLLTAVIYKLPMVWDFPRLLMFFVVSWCLGSLSMLIAFLIKRRSYALAVFVGYILLENIVATIIPVKWLPFQTCKRLLAQGIYEWKEIALVGVYLFTFLGIGRGIFSRSDLR